MLRDIQYRVVDKLTAKIDSFLKDAKGKLPARADSGALAFAVSTTAKISFSTAKIEARFSDELALNFDKLLDEYDALQSNNSTSSMFEGLSIINDDELEENIVIDSIVAKLNSANPC